MVKQIAVFFETEYRLRDERKETFKVAISSVKTKAAPAKIETRKLQNVLLVFNFP